MPLSKYDLEFCGDKIQVSLLGRSNVSIASVSIIRHQPLTTETEAIFERSGTNSSLTRLIPRDFTEFLFRPMQTHDQQIPLNTKYS
jgi:hypothetical protein